MPDTNLTAGQLSAARRTYTGTAADLEAILEEWDVHIVDEVDDNPERNPHVGFIPAEGTSLVDALLAWRDAKTADVLATEARAAKRRPFPGVPGSRWRDADGTVWVLCDDGRMRAARHNTAPNEVVKNFGPMTRVGGEG